MELDSKLQEKFKLMLPHLNEKQRRLYLSIEARSIGRGGISRVAEASGISKPTIMQGLRELDSHQEMIFGNDSGRIRKPGGGRKSILEKNPTLLQDLDSLISPLTRGDPMSPLRWCCKSLRNLQTSLKDMGYQVSYRVIGDILEGMGYSLQSTRKINEGKQHADRDAQFNHINDTVKVYLSEKQPAISVDCKKKELIGNYKNQGREWQPVGYPEEVNVYDFEDKSMGKAIPYGVYDLDNNKGWVNVGVDSDTARFAVNSIRTWWQNMGKVDYPQADKLLLTADGGGSNGRRNRLWKSELQNFANESGLQIEVCHLPPGTSKWNKIEHRLFSYITMNWRGKPLNSVQTIVSLIASTKTKKGLVVRAVVDENKYPTGIKVSDKQLKEISIIPNDFHGEWNYIIEPKKENVN